MLVYMFKKLFLSEVLYKTRKSKIHLTISVPIINNLNNTLHIVLIIIIIIITIIIIIIINNNFYISPSLH
jgi:hypothetical protein